MMSGRRQRVNGTREWFVEFYSSYSRKTKSTKTNKPATTQFVRNSSSLTRNAVPTDNLGLNGARSSFAKKKITTSSSTSTKNGCFSISINEQTQSFPIFARPNCETPWRNSAGTSASRVRNRGSIGESSCRSIKILSLTSGSTRQRTTSASLATIRTRAL